MNLSISHLYRFLLGALALGLLSFASISPANAAAPICECFSKDGLCSPCPVDPPAPTSPSVPLIGDTSCSWGDGDCNLCVPDVRASFNGLRTHGDISGFHMNGAPDVKLAKHWQGVQRLQAGSGRYMVVSRSGEDVAFVVTHMQSRNGTGERFRSNRLAYNLDFRYTMPPWNDGIVTVVDSDYGYDHAGGIQVIGDVLAVPLENGSGSRVVFWDMSVPANPQRLYTLELSSSSVYSDVGHAGAAAVTKIQDGRYIVAVAGYDARKVDFYVSDTTDIRDPNTQFTRFHSRTSGLPNPYQTINFVNQCDGKIFLVGTHGSNFYGADKVEWSEVSGTTHVTLSGFQNRHMHCSYRSTSGADTHCNFVAAAGVYITPSQKVLLYATEHDNDGPAGSVKYEEFRNEFVQDCPTINDAWVELYDDDTFRDRGLMIDYVDRNLRNYENYDNAEDFEDRASSAKWCIPPGWRYRLYKDKNSCGGSYRDLTGIGSEDDFKDISFGDDASCSRWLPY